MKCDKAQEFFSDYIENTLDRPMTVALETHLNGCEQCRADVAGLKQMFTVLDQVPQVEPPADFVWRTTTRLQNERLNRREAERARPLPWWKRLTPVQSFSYAGIAALLLIGLVVRVPSPVGSVTGWGYLGWLITNRSVSTPQPRDLFPTPPQFSVQVPGLNGAAATVTITATSETPYASAALGYMTPSGQNLMARMVPYSRPRTMQAGERIPVDVQVGGPLADHAATIALHSNGSTFTFSKVLILPGASVVNAALQSADPYFALEQIAARTGQAMLVDGAIKTRVTVDLQNLAPDQARQSVLNQIGARSSVEPSGVVDITR